MAITKNARVEEGSTSAVDRPHETCCHVDGDGEPVFNRPKKGETHGLGKVAASLTPTTQDGTDR